MTPYLSVIMGIGGYVTVPLRNRLSKAVQFMKGDIELVIVEWNTEMLPLRTLKSLARFPIRIIHAGHVHPFVPNPFGFGYFEWYPKNIGIRRANGEFVLSTNPDDIWSEELAEFFSRRQLQHGHFYRANRHDTRDGKVFRVCHTTGVFPPDSSDETIRTQIAPGACKWSPDMLHYNASGDFMLMARDDWFKIHGNPERDYNHTVDGQTVYLAHQKGLKQVILPYPIYHPDHERTLNIAGGKFVGPSWDDKKPFTKENEDCKWGFAGMEFEETIL